MGQLESDIAFIENQRFGCKSIATAKSHLELYRLNRMLSVPGTDAAAYWMRAIALTEAHIVWLQERDNGG